MANDEWYCRLEGRVEGPFSSRTLKTMALLGEIIPTDEIRNGLDGNWQAAKLVKGLQFKSNTRTAPPAFQPPEESQEEVVSVRYRYKMVQIPPNIQIDSKTPEHSSAATYLQNIVNENAVEGWEFYRVDTIGVRVKPGCLGVFLMSFSGEVPPIVNYYVVTFRRSD